MSMQKRPPPPTVQKEFNVDVQKWGTSMEKRTANWKV